MFLYEEGERRLKRVARVERVALRKGRRHTTVGRSLHVVHVKGSWITHPETQERIPHTVPNILDGILSRGRCIERNTSGEDSQPIIIYTFLVHTDSSEYTTNAKEFFF